MILKEITSAPNILLEWSVRQDSVIDVPNISESWKFCSFQVGNCNHLLVHCVHTLIHTYVGRQSLEY